MAFSQLRKGALTYLKILKNRPLRTDVDVQVADRQNVDEIPTMSTFFDPVVTAPTGVM
jgi:hypothetical protein